MTVMGALLVRRRLMLVSLSIGSIGSMGWFGSVAGCSSMATATGPRVSNAAKSGTPPIGTTVTTPSELTAPPHVTCAQAMQTVHKHWDTDSLQVNADVREMYVRAGSKLTPALVALCQTDAWSPTGRACVARAANLTAVDVCTRDFSASQQAQLQATTAEIIDSVDLSIRPATSTGALQP